MQFIYDKQTFQDLEILKDTERESVLSVFNHTKTEGGNHYLKELIKNPLADKAELEERTGLIRFLMSQDIDLNIGNRSLKFILRYISLNATVLRSNPIDRLIGSISERVMPSNDYYLIKSGCENLIALFLELRENLNFDTYPESLCSKLSDTMMLLGALSQELNTNASFSFRRVAKLDRLFRMKFSETLLRVLRELYFMDAFISIAKTASKNGFTLPVYVYSPKPILHVRDLRHPLVKNPVVNDINIGLEQNMCFLTGPNMAGKSTFLKAVGISVYLAHVGFPVSASKFETSLYSGMITTINLSDDLSAGHSHFYSEVNRVKSVAKLLSEGRRVFVIFDELFRGTNVKDAQEASTAIVKAFAKINSCMFFMSTHIVEVADEVMHCSGIDFSYFDSSLSGENLTYSYQIKKGVSDERLGMFIVKKEGIFELLDAVIKQ